MNFITELGNVCKFCAGGDRLEDRKSFVFALTQLLSNSLFHKSSNKDHICVKYIHILPFTDRKSTLLQFRFIYKT